MGVPKRKTSKMRLRTRKAANRWHAPKLSKCPQCGAAARSHVACPSCGYYKERQVLTVDAGQSSMRIALDAMGGDFAPVNPVAGVLQALREYSDFTAILVGDEEKVRAEMARHDFSGLESRVTIHHASQVVEMKDSAIDSVRRKKDSSISRAVDLVKAGSADAVVSAGHTGALVAAATIKLRTLPGIHRPGLAVVIPTEKKGFLLLDAGANIDAAPEHVLGYAIMGSIYAREIMGCQNPKVGLMSIGTEDSKGNDFSKACFQLLSKAPINFAGNTEGHALFRDPLDVVVCDGFVGNIVLKTVEGLAKSLFGWLKRELTSSPIRSIGAWISRGAFLSIKKRISADEYGGSPLLGVNGICIKAHGNSSPMAIKNAIRVAREFVTQKINTRIVEATESYHEKQAADPLPTTQPHGFHHRHGQLPAGTCPQQRRTGKAG